MLIHAEIPPVQDVISSALAMLSWYDLYRQLLGPISIRMALLIFSEPHATIDRIHATLRCIFYAVLSREAATRALDGATTASDI